MIKFNKGFFKKKKILPLRKLSSYHIIILSIFIIFIHRLFKL